MKKFILKIFLLDFLMIPAVMLMNFMFHDDIHSYTRIMMEEMYDYEGNIDVVFLGSSHTYRSYDTELADSILNCNTFNAGSSSQGMDGSYYLLKEISSKNNIKTVYLDTYYSILQGNKPGSTETYILTDYMKNTENRFAYLWKAEKMNGIVNALIPILHSKKFNCIPLMKAKMSGGYQTGNYEYVTYEGEKYMGNGFVYSFETVSNKSSFLPDAQIMKEKPISDYSIAYLNKIVQYCKNNQIELVLVTAPMPDAMLTQVTDYQVYIDLLDNYANENDIEYWNFNLCKREELFMDYNDFKDNNHLNGHGAEKFTRYICNKILSGDNINKQDFLYSKYADKVRYNPDGTL